MSPAGRFEEEKIICGCRDSSHDPSIVHPEAWSLHRLRCTFPSVKLGLNKIGWVWYGLDDRLRTWGLLSLLYNGYRLIPGGKAAGAWHCPTAPI